MKIFLDTADRSMIKKLLPTGLVDGVTTNPTLLSKEPGTVREIVREICSMLSGDVSIEVVEKNPELVYKQAQEIASLAYNIVVKIPFSLSYLPVIDRLVKEGIKVNITLVFTSLQALMVAKLGVTYISPFIGRLDDTGVEGMLLIDEIMQMKRHYQYSSQILAASVRSLNHWRLLINKGVDVATIPPHLVEQANIHPLTEAGIKKFDEDWLKSAKTF